MNFLSVTVAKDGMLGVRKYLYISSDKWAEGMGFRPYWRTVYYLIFFSILCLTTDLVHEGHERRKKKKTASNVPIVAIDVTTSLSLTGYRDWVLCIEYEVFI